MLFACFLPYALQFTPMPLAPDNVTFHNRSGMFHWGLAIICGAFIGLLTWQLLLKQTPSDWSPLYADGFIVCIWMAWIALVVHALRVPCVRVTVLGTGNVSVVWRYPLRMRACDFSLNSIATVGVTETRDAEGAPYFHAMITLEDGTSIELSRGPNRVMCEAQCNRFLEATEHFPQAQS